MNFDEQAKMWDTDERINRAKTIANEIVNSINVNENYSVMEFGCGTGLVSFNLHNKFKKITLIDSSKGMIDVLNSKINNYKMINMVAKHIDVSDKNSLNENFDIIYSSMVLHHIHDTKTIIKNFYESLNNNGYICIVDLNEEDRSFHKEDLEFDGHNGFNQEELKKILLDIGFNDIESNTFYYDKKVIDGAEINYSLFLIKGRKCEKNMSK